MANSAPSPLVRHLRRAALARADGDLTDGQLLECFLTRRDEAAFAVLVRRHGPMVLGVCRRVLQNHHDAEDAFQAAFLVLARKAAAIGRRELLSQWLYGVAYRTALKARGLRACRAARERQVRAMARPHVSELEEDVWQDLLPLLDRELSRLPEKYQVPLVLCDLEGKTKKEAARQLGLAEGTLSSRLARARALLRKRLERHSSALSAGLLAVALSQNAASACVPAPLVVLTAKAATTVMTGGAAAPVVSAGVVALTEGVLKAMFLTKLRIAAVLVLTVGLCFVGGSVLTYHAFAAEEAAARREDAPQPAGAGKKVGEVRHFEGHTGWVHRVAFSPDGHRAASCSMDGTVRVWDVKTGKELRRLDGHRDRVECVAFTPDGLQLLSCAWDGTVRLWDAASGRELKRFHVKGAPGLHVCNVVFFPGAKRFLWNSVDHHSLQVWDLENGALEKEFAEHPDHVCAVALTPDGRRALEGNWDSMLRLWDVETGKQLRQFPGHQGKIYCVTISPNGRQALSASVGDDVALLWDLETGKEIRRLKGHRGHVDFVAFAPDGLRALSCGPDKTVRLWDVKTGKELHCFTGHTDRVDCVAFSPDGRFALSGSHDQTLRLWRLPR